MKIFDRKIQWETVILVALLALISVGFVATLVMMFTVRKPESAPVKKVAAVEEVGPLRSKARYFSSRPMTVHVFEEESQPLAAFRDPDSSQKKLIPDVVPDTQRGRETSFDSMMDMRPTMPVRNARAEEDLLAEEEEKVTTGWGWLADDIAKSRSGKDKTDGSSGQKKTDDAENADEEAEEDERLAAEKNKEEDEKSREGQIFFMNEAFESASAKNDPLSRSALRDENRDRYIATDSDRDERSQEEMDEEAVAEDKAGESWRASADETREGDLGRRDAFSRADGQRLFADDAWGFSREADLSSRRVENSATAAALARAEENQREDQSMRIIGDADNDARRMSVGWTGYASDSMFNSGGGYTPRGVAVSGGDSLFSGAGVFDNASAGIVMPISPSSEGLSAPAGSSLDASSFSTPIGGSRSATEISTPRALPW